MDFLKKWVKQTFINFITVVFFTQTCLYACDIEDAILQAKPDRTLTWQRAGGHGITYFNEYYVSGQDLACGFRALGYDSRQEAIDTLLLALADSSLQNRPQQKRLKQFVSSSILSDKNLLKTIFGPHLPPNLDAFAMNHSNQQRYLEYYRDNKIELPFTANRTQQGEWIQTDREYGLINALSILSNVNLYIYEPLFTGLKTLFLSHAFTNPSVQNSVHLLYKGAHYNALALVGDTQTNSLLQQNEETYLDILMHSLQTLPSRIDDDMDCADDYAPPLGPQTQRDESHSQETALTFAQSNTIQIGQSSFDSSCKATYDHLHEPFKKGNVNAMTSVMELVLKKNFVPEGLSRTTFLEILLNELNVVISTPGKSYDKQRHYAQIFIGQLLTALGHYQKAYDLLDRLRVTNKKFTTRYLIDIAKLIIDHGIVPSGKTPDQALDYALDMIISLNKTKKTCSSQSLSSYGRKDNASVNPPTKVFVNSLASRDEIKDLVKNASRKRSRQEIQSKNKSSLSKTQKPARKRAHLENNTTSSVPKEAKKQNKKPSSPLLELPYLPDDEMRIDINNDSPLSNDDLVLEETYERQAQCEGFLLAARAYKRKGDNVNSAKCYHLVLSTAHEEDIYFLCKALIGLGNTRYKDENHRYESDWFLEALKVLGSYEDPSLRAQTLIGLGHTRYTNKEYPDNSHWFLEALKVLGLHGDPSLRAQALVGLGNTQYTNKEYPDNSHWFLEALKVLGLHGDTLLRAQALVGLGHARYTDENHKDNYLWYIEALEELGSNGNLSLRFQALLGLGNARHTDKNHPTNDEWFHDAYNLAQRNKDKRLMHKASISLKKFYQVKGPKVLEAYWTQQEQKLAAH